MTVLRSTQSGWMVLLARKSSARQQFCIKVHICGFDLDIQYTS